MTMALQQPPADDDEEEATIRTRLLQSFGVQPCQEWLQACLSHLRNNLTNRNNNVVVVDGVLHQLLHADLRDVVRTRVPSSPSGAGGSFHTAASALSGSDTSTAAQQLQQALQQSLQSPYKHTLPNNFLLMCQLEEVCDASLPAEKRIEVAVSAPSGQSSSSSQRCLKLCLTDGYQYHNNNKNNKPYYFVGFEMQAPIPNLAADAPAGRKILLKGPVIVRHGQLLLTPANGIVLGGHVHALEQQQRQALQKAKQAAGVGVDPTIRALIGVDNEINDIMENEDQDEAHEASGDVLPRQPWNPVVTQTTPSVTAAAAAAPMPSTRRGPQHTATLATATPTSAWAPSQQQQPQQIRNQQPPQNHYQQQQQPLQQRPIQPTNQSQPQRTPPPTNRARPYVNPYATGSSHSSASTAATTTTTSNPYVQSRTTNTVASVNPYRNSNSTAASTESRSTTVNSTIPASSNTSMISPSTIPRTVVPNPNEPNPTTTSTSSSSTTTSTTVPQRTNIQNMTFPNLCILLTNLVQNREMYQSYSEIFFRVTLTKAPVGSVNFNVVKNKHHHKKDPTSQKYEYYIALLFAGISDHDQRLCCRIHSSLLDPHFEVSAADLRSISRTDRERSHHITNAGGDRVKQHYFGPCTWTASLYLPVEEVFGDDNKTPAERLTDLNHPIVMLQDPEPYKT
jgi:RecQ mediated genome instability protein